MRAVDSPQNRNLVSPAVLLTVCGFAVTTLAVRAAEPVQAPVLDCSLDSVSRMYALALRTVAKNIHSDKRGLMSAAGPILHAGKGYPDCWTRDAAFNTMMAAALVAPEAARNSLYCEVMRDDQYGMRIGDAAWFAFGSRMRGQHWDAIAWVSGAWAYFSTTGDEAFLKLAYGISRNAMRFYEDTELDRQLGLFDGPASYGDGVSAYPLPYGDAGKSSFILDTQARVSGKFVMKALSTNCLFANAYQVLAEMARHAGEDDQGYLRKAAALKQAINDRLWLADRGRYAYFLDMQGRPDDHMEALGHAFVILFGIAPPDRAAQVLGHQYISPNGIPCVWPLFPEYKDGFARHCGTVWPHAQGFWAWAAASVRDEKRFADELAHLTRLASGSRDFREIYHPITGKPFGGWQVGSLWESERGQTWSATAYLSMVHHGVFGLRLSENGLDFQPILPESMAWAKLRGLRCRKMLLDVSLKGRGKRIASFVVDGRSQQPHLEWTTEGNHRIEIVME